ncbi:MAG: aminoglycoside phosphotransferase family protein [Sphingomonadales bacterium]|nr:aminoglycoside phosphotransferase family protein [Sphingomonadales bacterium]
MTAVATHLVHGMGMALVTPTWPAIAMPEAEAIVSRFPAAGNVVGLRWHSPRPFSAAALVHTSRGEFFLKRHHRKVRAPGGLAEEHVFIAHLRAAGLPVPQVMQTGAGIGTVSDGEWTYELHRKAPGLDLYRDSPSWTPFRSHHHARAAGAELARLHQAARGFDAPARLPQPLVTSFTILPAADPLGAVEAYISARPALAAFLAGRRWPHELSRLFDALADGLGARLAGQASLWTHNDWHPSNLLWTRAGEVRTVFDFGLTDLTCALHDIATAIERCAFQWLQLGQGADDSIADPQTAVALIAGYRTVLPLSSTDAETIVRLLPLVHVEFALSEVDYFYGVLAEPDHAAMAWDAYLIGHALWFLSPAGIDFLSQVEQGVQR